MKNVKNETLLTRIDGTLIKIITTVVASVNGTINHDTYLLSKRPSDTNWTLTQSGYPTMAHRARAMAMPITEYLEFGRPPMFALITIAELLKNVRDTYSKFNE